MDKTLRQRHIYLNRTKKRRIVGFEKFELKCIALYQKNQKLHQKKRVYYRSALKEHCTPLPFGLKYTDWAI
jgi:hypothetical protein